MSAFNIMGPYYVGYTSLMNFHIADITKSRAENQGKIPIVKNIMKHLYILPVMLALLIILDIIYMLVSLIIRPILLGIKILSFNRMDYHNQYDELAERYF